jgi:hypothetical protein
MYCILGPTGCVRGVHHRRATTIPGHEADCHFVAWRACICIYNSEANAIHHNMLHTAGANGLDATLPATDQIDDCKQSEALFCA